MWDSGEEISVMELESQKPKVIVTLENGVSIFNSMSEREEEREERRVNEKGERKEKKESEEGEE